MAEAREIYEQAHANEQAGRLADAEAGYRRVLELEPQHADALMRLALLREEAAHLPQALELARRAVAAAPQSAAAHTAVGRVLGRLGQDEAALAPHAIAARLAPDDGETVRHLGLAQWRAGRLEAALATLRRAVALGPESAAARAGLARALFDAGALDEALEVLNGARGEGRAAMIADDMRLFFLHFHPATTPDLLQAEHQRWATRHAAALTVVNAPHPNERSPDRRLRIGYVSADLREHPVAHAVVPLLAAHDREKHEVFIYSSARETDAVTQRCRAAADVWRDVASLTDAELAQQVRADGIDILVDLSLHTTRHRLLAFACRPAPVQVTWAGYPGMTGLAAIGYRLTDRWLDPPTQGESFHAEKSVHLPDSFWCYDPLGESPAVNALPARQTGTVTFGCLNKCAKINATTAALWAPVLRAVPRSRLLVRATNALSRERLRGLFVAQNIAADRLEFVGWSPRPEYLALHHRIDLALDPVPYGGHMTLLDALWMGVPTIALPGTTPVSRAGLSLLTNAGLPEWVADSSEDFARIAVEHTRDLEKLAGLRAGLRERLRASPLMDAPRFARRVETEYRKMWREWCGRAEP